jgi:hypothetical protein
MGDEQVRNEQSGISNSKCAAQHYTVAEIAAAWKLSEDTIRKLFRHEPGVLVIGNQKPRYGRRRYLSLRIPEFVIERVHRRLSVP